MAVEFVWSAPYSVKMGSTPELTANKTYTVVFANEGLSNFDNEVVNVQVTPYKDTKRNGAEFFVYEITNEGFTISNSGGNINYFSWQATGH